MSTHALERCDLGAGRAVGHANRILADDAVKHACVGIEAELVGASGEYRLESAPGDKAARSNAARPADVRFLELRSLPRRLQRAARGHAEGSSGFDKRTRVDSRRLKISGTSVLHRLASQVVSEALHDCISSSAKCAT